MFKSHKTAKFYIGKEGLVLHPHMGQKPLICRADQTYV